MEEEGREGQGDAETELVKENEGVYASSWKDSSGGWSWVYQA